MSCINDKIRKFNLMASSIAIGKVLITTQKQAEEAAERVNREIKRRAKAICVFSDGQRARLLVFARLCFAAASDWGISD